MRLDQFISTKYNYSRTKAKQLIERGYVYIDDVLQDKPSQDVNEDTNVTLKQEFKYVSLGGYKLEKALIDFNFDLNGAVCLDIGASNGGFSDCMLQNGAKKIYALDVGDCALEDKVRYDERVIIKDNMNARFTTIEDIGEYVDFVSIDVSFISLKLVLPTAYNLLKENGHCIALIKPQFEAGKKNLSKKGIVQSQKVIDSIIKEISFFSETIKFKVLNVTSAPIVDKKNREYLILLEK